MRIYINLLTYQKCIYNKYECKTDHKLVSTSKNNKGIMYIYLKLS